MKTRTTLLLLLITLGAAAWLLLKESGGPADLRRHLLFDWHATALAMDKTKLKVAVEPAEVAGLDLKNKTVELALRRQAGGEWAITKGVTDRADPDMVDALLGFLNTARIEEVIKASEMEDGAGGAAALGLDDAGAWRVTWLNAAATPLAEARVGRTAPLGTGCYVQFTGVKSRPDVYIVSPDLRPKLAQPLDSWRDPRACRFSEEKVAKLVTRVGEGEVELSRELRAGYEPGPWKITRPLANAPADQEITKQFAAAVCGLRGKGWVPYTETTDKPLVEISIHSGEAGAKPSVLAFFPDPTAGEPAATALCRDAQRKAAFKVDKDMVEDFQLAGSPNPFRSHRLPALEPGIISTVEVRTPKDSVTLARVGDRWAWRPLAGGEWQVASVDQLEKLISLVNECEVLDFASDSLAAPGEFALDQPDYILTFAAGRHASLDKLTPITKANSRTLRIAIRQDGLIFANFEGDPFVYRMGPELPQSIPQAALKWRSLTLPSSFSSPKVRSIRLTRGAEPPIELKKAAQSLRWTGTRGDQDITEKTVPGAIEALANRLGTLSVANWLENSPAAVKALELPALTIEVKYVEYADKTADDSIKTMTLWLAPVPGSPEAPMWYGRHSSAPEPFLINSKALRDAADDILVRQP
jgi:Domain of unknown function (DUF4340)